MMMMIIITNDDGDDDDDDNYNDDCDYVDNALKKKITCKHKPNFDNSEENNSFRNI